MQLMHASYIASVSPKVALTSEDGFGPIKCQGIKVLSWRLALGSCYFSIDKPFPGASLS